MEKFNELILSDKPVLVDFFATWCGPCRMMSPILEELKTKIGDTAHILKMDIDKESNRELVARYQIRSVPTLILFRNGSVVWRQSGVVPAAELQKVIDESGKKD